MRKLKLKGVNKKETKKKYINYYINNYIITKNGKEIIIRTKDRIRVLFYDSKDIHAYTRSKSVSRSKKERCFDFNRALRLNWIKDVIEETCNEKIYKKDFYDKKKSTMMRGYFVTSEKYFLVLKKNKAGNFVFKSHYVLKTYKEYLKRVKLFGFIQ